MLYGEVLDIAGMNVLVVEDEALAAFEMEDAVKGAGGVVLGPVPSVEAAMIFLDGHERIDAAILDVRLHDGDSVGVAQLLKQRGVRLIFVTGYDDWYMPDDLSDVQVAHKPADPHNVIRLLFGSHLNP